MPFFSRARRLQTQLPEKPLAQPAPQRAHLSTVPYLLPKDTQEDQRLHFQHHILYRTISNHYLAPLTAETATTILDVGTGTGIWPVAMASLFPQANILGVDIALTSLPRPLPPTCLFSQANILDGLPFPAQQFSYTHQRLLVAAIPARHWPGVVRELVRVTRPLGWIELLEVGVTIQHAGPATKRLLDWMTGISQSLGFDLEIVRHLGDLLTHEGCQAVEAQDIPVPLGEWAGQVGQMLKMDVLQSFHAIKDTYCPRSQTPPETFDAMVQEAAEEWELRQAAYVFHSAYGRRATL